MARLVAPNDGNREVAIKTETQKHLYRAQGGGIFDVSHPNHVAQMKANGFVEATLMGASTDASLGFTCSECGFNGWFRKCSKCGHEAE